MRVSERGRRRSSAAARKVLAAEHWAAATVSPTGAVETVRLVSDSTLRCQVLIFCTLLKVFIFSLGACSPLNWTGAGTLSLLLGSCSPLNWAGGGPFAILKRPEGGPAHRYAGRGQAPRSGPEGRLAKFSASRPCGLFWLTWPGQARPFWVAWWQCQPTAELLASCLVSRTRE